MKRRTDKRIDQIVRDKRLWEGPREPEEADVETAIGSKGWYTRGYLPHYDKPGTIQMVTFRLADAMPASLRHEWESLLAIGDERERQTKIEEYLDRGRGECLLKDARVAAAVEEVFLRFDGQRYRMTAWVVMPNHAHISCELWDIPLGKLLKAWKGASANAANRVIGRSGTFWQTEYWDRYMRDEEHFQKTQHYIEWNPVKAGLARHPEDWPFSSANPKWQWSGPNRYKGARLLNSRTQA
jgi:putative transposase